MIQPIVRDVMFLSCKSQMATAEDLPVARDLADTLRAHAHECGLCGKACEYDRAGESEYYKCDQHGGLRNSGRTENGGNHNGNKIRLYGKNDFPLSPCLPAHCKHIGRNGMAADEPHLGL